MIHNHLGDLAALPNLLNDDLSRSFTGTQMAEKQGWTGPMTTSVWWGFINGPVSDLPTDKEACSPDFAELCKRCRFFIEKMRISPYLCISAHHR
jgi:hypothetical protein